MHFLSALLKVLFIAYGAVVWRLRGGAWNTWLNISMGTIATRIVTGFLFAMPMALATGSWWLLLSLTLATWLGLSIAGWGPFMTMGNHPTPPKKTWIDIFPKMLGLTPGSVAWDFVGMVACGVLLFTPMVLSFGVIALSWWMIPIVMIASLLFATDYLLWSKAPQVPNVPGFASGYTEWAEVTAGALVSVLLMVTVAVI